jgi:hypothetical protein
MGLTAGLLLGAGLQFSGWPLSKITDQPSNRPESQPQARATFGDPVQAQSRPPERAVFGELAATVPAATVEPAKELPAPPAEPDKETPVWGGDYGRYVPADIRAFLDKWRLTLVSGDLNGQAELYAPHVQRFFTRSNVSRKFVRQEKARLLSEYPNFKRYTISDVTIEALGDNHVTLTFRKDWDARGKRRYAGAERQRLRLERFRGDWKIVREEETRIYWVRRS